MPDSRARFRDAARGDPRRARRPGASRQGAVHRREQHRAWRLGRALWISDTHRYARFEWVQNAYSLLERGDERELFPVCLDQGLRVTPFSPLAGGWLAGRYRQPNAYPAGSRMTLRPEPYQHLVRPEVFAALDALRARAERRGLAVATLALAWVLGHPLTTAAIIGPRSMEHLELARGALDVELSETEHAALFAGRGAGT